MRIFRMKADGTSIAGYSVSEWGAESCSKIRPVDGEGLHLGTFPTLRVLLRVSTTLPLINFESHKAGCPGHGGGGVILPSHHRRYLLKKGKFWGLRRVLLRGDSV
ncbi:hypothetical protein FKM82_018474 [Ascaphus truei]